MLEQAHGGASARSGSSHSLVPGLIAVVLIGAAVAVGMLNRPESSASEEQQAEVVKGPAPFSDMPPEEPPKPRAGSGRPAAPEGLAEQTLWVDAVAIADQGEELFQLARKAKAAGEHTKANKEGRAAREKFNEAVEMTAAWEEELLEKYGDRDPQVRAIKHKRTRWFTRLDWLLKSIAR